MGFFFSGDPAPTKGAKGKSAAKPVAAKKQVVKGKDKPVIPIRVLGKKYGGCARCSLNAEEKNLHHPKMKPTGSETPVIYVLGEAPGKNEDEYGEQFIGKSGELIRDFIPRDLDGHVRWSNTVRCRPPENRTPTREEIVACSQFQVEDIERTQPAVVMGFGSVPLQWATMETAITDWRGTLMPMRIGTHACWYAPIWHPSYILRAKNDRKMGEAFFSTYKRDLLRVFDAVRSGTLDEPFVPEGEELSAGMHWELSWDLKEVEAFLEHMSQFEKQAVDIETNGMRPYSKDAKILSISFGTWDLSYAIPVRHREAQWTDTQVKQLWKIIGGHMRKKGHTFIAHNLKFEQEWLSMPWALGRNSLFEVQWGDTMAQAEVLRTQSMHAKSLNSRCLGTFGVPEKSLDNMDRGNLDLESLPKVLRYNARDTKFTDLLRQIQDRQIEQEGLEVAYQMMVSRCVPLTIAQQEGMVPDVSFAEAKHKELKVEVERIEAKLQKLPDVLAMVTDTKKPFNSGSPAQLAVLLRDRLKLQEGWRTVGKVRKYSTDEEVLARIKHPVGKLILDKRGVVKLDSTYVVGLCGKGIDHKDAGKLIWDDGLIHTEYNHLIATTGRTSSSGPNLQNYPKREHKEIRNCVIAPPGHLMVSVDYGQIEARVIAMASRCPVMHKSMWEHYDIHMDWAKKISKKFAYVMVPYLKEEKGDEVSALKMFRQDIKNQWTFPLFFGSQLSSVADALKIPAGDLKGLFDEFWEMFAEVKRWQERVLALYRSKGYVETLTGRRRSEPLSLNECINSPIQGTASDIVVDAMERLSQHAYETQIWHRAARMNIHDELVFLLPNETTEVDTSAIVAHMACSPFDFINVPITVEIAAGRNWGSLTDIGQVESTEFGFPKREKASG